MKTKLTVNFGIQYPIVQGAMVYIADSKLAAAVSNAGGLGTIATGGQNVQWIEAEITKAKALTDKPFSVNVVLMEDDKEEKIDAVIRQKPFAVTLGAGNPRPYIEKIKNAGIKVITVVPSLRLAKRMEESGADAVVIEGMEAGGHIGTQTTMVLMAQVIPHISIPVIVAGGFASGNSVAAALLMGAAGVQMGTRFFASTECIAHPNAKQALVDAGDDATQITGYLARHMVRGIKNEFTEEYLKKESEGASAEELEKFVIGTSRKGAIDGDRHWGMVHAGQIASIIDKVEPADTIMQKIMAETVKTLQHAQALLNS
ncbi:nitronate monooxygenase [Treponema phagedenis]|uniref:nitronate monooxygenase n=1 Tax=Treponema phagedenis TaxID=162 RepID=UPI0004637F7E|nr:nitronate monooxygenase [Treponema phagedenis]NVP25395.1 nitronate monooxygenase [Treponema phagedenis]QKS92169.1 nitronate monooxygenase [Treponema phagedenis]QLC57520.1 nitronate monooxygenase [Treponema phagedenis]